MRLNEILLTKDNGEAKRVPISKFKVYQVRFAQLCTLFKLLILGSLGQIFGNV